MKSATLPLLLAAALPLLAACGRDAAPAYPGYVLPST